MKTEVSFFNGGKQGTALEGGSTLLWPLWLHAREAGTISLNTVVYYEPDKSIAGLLYRTVRMTHTLQVSLFKDLITQLFVSKHFCQSVKCQNRSLAKRISQPVVT